MPKYEGAYEGTTGLKEAFSGKITEAEFMFDSEYMNGTQLIARIVVEDASDGQEVVLKLSTGKGWEDDDKGVRAKKEDGSEPGKGFNKQTSWYMFTKAAASLDGFGEWMQDTAPPWDITPFLGEPEFEFDTASLPGVEKGSTRNVVTPVKYLGGGNVKGARKGGAAKAPATDAPEETKAQAAKRKAAEKKAAAAAAESGDDEGELGTLKEIAARTDSHEEFMEAAYSELVDADALEESILDEDFYTTHHG